MEIKDVPAALWVSAGGAAGWLGKNIWLWIRGRRLNDAQAESTLGDAWLKMHTAMTADINRERDASREAIATLRAEMKQRDKECDERMTALAKSLRADFDEQNLKLRSIIYSLAKKIPLDRKQREILESIAPEAEPAPEAAAE